MTAPTHYHRHDPHSYRYPEIKRGHYTNFQKILLVGEGDFSFSSTLATSFHSASNITATSLDTRETVISRYSQGRMNLLNLEERGALVLHQVDAHQMDRHSQLCHQLFDRIVFNFPHSGGLLVRETDNNCIRLHQRVVSGFLMTSRFMLTKIGEVHITHKTSHPFNTWNIVDLAEDAGLMLTREALFDIWDYPGYVNRKGYGPKWNSSFPVGEASTFIFSS